jgi:hypothetical protein
MLLVFIDLSSLQGATFNVTTVTEFQNALTTAENNGEDDIINVAAGTYTLSTALAFNSSENHSLTVNGNNSPVLDGNNTVQAMNIINFGTNASISINGLTIKNGIADYGGGLYVETDIANISLQNCTFEDNTGNIICGGANCYSVSGDIQVESCTFINNSAPNTSGYPNGTAGGLFVQTEDPGTTITLSDSYFSENFAMRDAAGAMLYPLGNNSTVNANNNTFSNNTANEFGGGCWIRCPGGNASIEYNYNTLTQNKAETAGSGGGTYIEIESGSINAGYNDHNQNTAIWDGAGLWIENQNGTIDLTRNTFTQNQSSNNGGGINIYIASGTVNVSRNTFDSNTATNIGGAMSLSTDSGTLNVYHNTTYANTATSEGGAIYLYFDQSSASSDIYNNIFWNDSSPAIAYSGAVSAVAQYSDISGGNGESWFGTGCIDADPLFEDESNSDFHITWDNFPTNDGTKSPCIDSGDPTSSVDSDGSQADMGRYYFDQTTLAMDLSSFDIKRASDNSVLISWSIFPANNQYLDYFTVRRSFNSFDWEDLINIEFSKNNKSYKLIDTPEVYGEIFYKIKYVDFNGNTSYSNTKSIILNKTIEVSFNNPVKNITTIIYTLNTNSHLKIELSDINGNRIKKILNKKMTKGNYKIQIPCYDLPSGIYFLIFNYHMSTLCKKMVIVN